VDILDTRLRFIGRLCDDYEITEFTGIGQYLYQLAKSTEIVNFLETGASTGGSGRCIATGLYDSSGELYTFEASKSRFKSLVNNLEGLPVVAFNESTVHFEGLSTYYNNSDSEFAGCNDSFFNIFRHRRFDACFLDSINLCQAKELRIVVENRVKNILMHEPDHKCPGYDSFLTQNGYQLITASRDEVNRIEGRNPNSHCQPLWVHYLFTDFPRSGSL
jgi:hypothetical protein